VKRWDIINKIIKRNSYTDYLEIGVRPNGNISKIEIENKTGVDPNKPTDYQITSDKFFTQCDDVFDVIFVDGLHLYEQVLRDIKNALQHLRPDGTIVVHDCRPKTKEAQMVPRVKGGWNGTVWKAWVELRCTRPDLSMYVIDADHGCGIIQRGQQEVYAKADLETCLTWDYFDKHKEELLNLKSGDVLWD